MAASLPAGSPRRSYPWLPVLIVGMTIVALALAWLGVLRATILMFHFGY